MPAKTDAGYALVPTSSDRRALLEFYDECNGIRWGALPAARTAGLFCLQTCMRAHSQICMHAHTHT